MAEIPAATLQVLRDSVFFVDPVPYVWLRASSVREPERHLIVIRDDRETTVVTQKANLDCLVVEERNPDDWHLLSIDCANPFYCVGFLGAITGAMAQAGVDVLALSTYTRDYVFAKREDLDRARAALRAFGMAERQG